MITIGFLELNSIAKGIEAADAMCKAGNVMLHSAKASCPGKFNILISGEVAAVQSAMKNGKIIGGSHVIDDLVIPRVHDQVLSAINMGTYPEHPESIGILEYFSVASAIVGADAAVKSANVSLIEIRMGVGIGGKAFVTLTGDVSACETAVKNGALAAEETGFLVSKVVIPHPNKQIYKTLF
ncbi:MAG: BMC domain-containing protein [Lachnospiraceae bacterium]|nr:BMC domain-containing protein [Lachnospiraceae bacterium]